MTLSCLTPMILQRRFFFPVSFPSIHCCSSNSFSLGPNPKQRRTIRKKKLSFVWKSTSIMFKFLQSWASNQILVYVLVWKRSVLTTYWVISPSAIFHTAERSFKSHNVGSLLNEKDRKSITGNQQEKFSNYWKNDLYFKESQTGREFNRKTKLDDL